MGSTFRTVTTKQFNKFLTDLMKKGKKGKDAMLKSRAAIAEAGMEGTISLKPTNYGESRLENVEKYDLGDGYRLVVQVVNPSAKERAFLFVGDHEDAERWLDNHKDYKWVKKESDNTLEFVQVLVQSVSPAEIPDFDLESPESIRELPLLRDVLESEWADAAISVPLVEYLCSISANLWEQDPNGILGHVEGKWGMDMACALLTIY